VPDCDVIPDLSDEQDRLETFLNRLTPPDWRRLSAAPPWTVADVVLHLAQTEEAVVLAISGATGDWRRDDGESVDETMARHVAAEAKPGPDVFPRWQKARRAALQALRAADPRQPLEWVATPLRSTTLATTRLAEHWAHALDVTQPFGVDYPDTDRIKHVAWLGHATLPYAFRTDGRQPVPVRVELTAPSGARWAFGPQEAPSRITGSASAFCRVGAQRLLPEESGLRTRGPHGATALQLLRTYAA
jgi:uncharacterized protein (TIGR03084 family)